MYFVNLHIIQILLLKICYKSEIWFKLMKKILQSCILYQSMPLSTKLFSGSLSQVKDQDKMEALHESCLRYAWCWLTWIQAVLALWQKISFRYHMEIPSDQYVCVCVVWGYIASKWFTVQLKHWICLAASPAVNRTSVIWYSTDMYRRVFISLAARHLWWNLKDNIDNNNNLKRRDKWQKIS